MAPIDKSCLAIFHKLGSTAIRLKSKMVLSWLLRNMSPHRCWYDWVAGHLVLPITICDDVIVFIRRADHKNLNNNLNSLYSVYVWTVLFPNLVVIYFVKLCCKLSVHG